MSIQKSLKHRARSFVVGKFLSYDAERLKRTLRSLGLGEGDVVMVHASWDADNGFRGRPADMINCLKELLGPKGVLAMPSLTYQNMSSREFLALGKPMDVRRSPSRMGLLSEVFRRGRDVSRSCSPTHPVLAWGERAGQFIAGHEQVEVPFGPDTPFARLLEWKGKVLTVDAPFSTITFCHYLEDRIAGHLPFELYESEPMTGLLVDREGQQNDVPVRVLSEQANRLRRDAWLVKELDNRRILQRSRIGNTRLLLADTDAMAQTVDQMYLEGRSFFELP